MLDKTIEILIADDNLTILESMTCLLNELKNVRVTSASYVDEALDRVAKGLKPDLVFTDFDFGTGFSNGYVLGEELRKQGYTGPIVMLSGADPEVVRAGGIARGLDKGGEFLNFVKGKHRLSEILVRLSHPRYGIGDLYSNEV